MNIFLIELKAHRKSLIFWSVGMMFMVFAGMSKYAAFDSSGQSMNEMLDTFPKSIKAILGLGDFDLSKASGFYGVLFLYLIIMATIHAVMLGANIIAKEERDKTAEFLFTKPINRGEAITFKLLASLVNIFILNIVTLIVSLFIVNYYGDEEGIYSTITILMLGMFILQLFYLTLGSVIASFCKRPKLASSVSTGVLLLTFLLSVMIDMTDKIDFLKYFTPFKYFEAKYVMENGSLKGIFVLISLMLTSAFVYFSYEFFKRRDLTV